MQRVAAVVAAQHVMQSDAITCSTHGYKTMSVLVFYEPQAAQITDLIQRTNLIPLQDLQPTQHCGMAMYAKSPDMHAWC
jgi:hypothetical protein